MFAPSYHPAMKHAMPVRRELALRTVFNMLGPLTNPAGAHAQVLGVYAPELTELHAGVLRNLGSERAFVVHGAGGLDELSIHGKTRVTELREGDLRTYEIAPEDVGLSSAAGSESIQGGPPEENAQLLTAILDGKDGPPRDIVVFNAAAAIAAGGKADSIKDGVPIAAKSIDSGAARRKLEQLQAF
jgi:anthranilate phosphoribosyltransferase